MTASRLTQGLLHGFRRFLFMFGYLYVVFTMFQLHEYIVLSEHDLSYTRLGFAVINALVLAKVMLIADELHLGVWFPGQPRIYRIVVRSVLFAAVMILFEVVEKTITGLIKGGSFIESVPRLAGGDLGTVMFGLILTAILLPFFAFMELSNALGDDVVRKALLAKPERRTTGTPA
jgi:hypothetical protein